MGNLLSKLGEELALMPVVEDASPEIWPVPKAMEVLLSPHNRAFQGLLTGAYRTPQPGEMCCACCTTDTPSIGTTPPTSPPRH